MIATTIAMKISGALAAAATLFAAADPTLAGPNLAEIEQIGAADGVSAADIGGLQLAAPSQVVEAPPPAPEERPLEQLNTEGANTASVADAPAPPPFERPDQLNDQQATVEAPAGPHAPFPQQTTVDAVFGADACDPAANGADDEVCANRIEARAADFAPKRSAEAQLMAESEAAGDDARAAARRLADGNVQNSDAAQAYVFTSGQTPTAQTGPQSLSPETQQALDAAAALLGVLPAGAVVTTR